MPDSSGQVTPSGRGWAVSDWLLIAVWSPTRSRVAMAYGVMPPSGRAERRGPSPAVTDSRHYGRSPAEQASAGKARARNLSHARLYFFFNDTGTTEFYTLSLHDAPLMRVV